MVGLRYVELLGQRQDDWLIIVADGSSAFDDEGQYRLTVRLTCRDGNCACP